MATTSHIHVRPLEIGDFDFVRNLASKQPNFTVPPVYVLWLMLRIEGAICLVAEHSSKGQLGYLLSVPVKGPRRSIFVWQLAVQSDSADTNPAIALLSEFRREITQSSIHDVLFSTVPQSAAFRTIRRYALKVFSSVPQRTSALPTTVAATESEFLLRLSDAQ